MENYFRYLPVSPELLRWGVVLSAAGFTRIPPRSSYPPAEHPLDHRLDWDHGRVIEMLQLVLISEGRGRLETQGMRAQLVEPGMLFMLLPNCWHRYRPEPRVGWVESWIEVRGPVVDELLQAGTFAPGTCLRRGALQCGIEDTLNRIHRLVLADLPGSRPELGALAMQVLSQGTRLSAGQPRISNIKRAVHQAEIHLRNHYHEALNVRDLAGSLGVAYSHFRRAFRAQTGFSPWQYVIHLRLARARLLMASGDTKLDDLAAQLGFSSGFHLSAAFKQAYGVSPAPWRKSLVADSGPPRKDPRRSHQP